MTAFLGGARRRRAYPTSITSTTAGGGGGGGGYTAPQTPDTTGAFAYYPLQEAVGAATLVDTIGGRNLTGGTLTQTPHQLFPGRKMLRAQSAWNSAVDALWNSPDITVEAIIYPFTTGTGPTITIVNNASGQENFRLQWNNGQIQYSHFGKNSVNPSGNPFYPGTASVIANTMPYLLRLVRDDTAKTLQFLMDGYLQYSDTYVTAPPVGDRFTWGVGSFFISDIIVWQTATAPVSAEDQVARVKPWLVAA